MLHASAWPKNEQTKPKNPYLCCGSSWACAPLADVMSSFTSFCPLSSKREARGLGAPAWLQTWCLKHLTLLLPGYVTKSICHCLMASYHEHRTISLPLYHLML